MDPRLQRRIQRYGWDRAAPLYERYWSDQLAPAQRLLLEQAALRSGERVLDVACGTGLVTFEAAASVGASGHVLATDISEAMVAHLAAAAAARGLTQVEARRMDAESLDVPDGAFDAVVCGWALEHLPDPEPGLRELARVLRPGGKFLLLVTEDTLTGAMCSRLWHCRTYNRDKLREVCARCGLVWGREMWFSKLHRALKLGGIIVECGWEGWRGRKRGNNG